MPLLRYLPHLDEVVGLNLRAGLSMLDLGVELSQFTPTERLHHPQSLPYSIANAARFLLDVDRVCISGSISLSQITHIIDR